MRKLFVMENVQIGEGSERLYIIVEEGIVRKESQGVNGAEWVNE